MGVLNEKTKEAIKAARDGWVIGAGTDTPNERPHRFWNGLSLEGDAFTDDRDACVYFATEPDAKKVALLLPIPTFVAWIHDQRPMELQGYERQ